MIQYMLILLDNRRREMSERGASAVEYGLLIAGIAAIIVVAVFALGPIVNDAFETTADEMTPAAPAGVITHFSMRIIG